MQYPLCYGRKSDAATHASGENALGALSVLLGLACVQATSHPQPLSLAHWNG